MDSQRSRSLIPWAIRSHRVGMLTMGLGFGFLPLVLGPAYLATAKAVSGGLKELAAQAQSIASSFQFLTGPVQRLDTVGGYLSYKLFPDLALLVAIYAAIQGAQLIRGSETKGLFDLWFAAGRPRAAILRDRLTGGLLSLSVIVVCMYAGTAIGGVLSNEQLAVRGIGQCAAIGLVALLALSLGFLVSQFVHTARTSASVVSGYLVASFFIANIADQLGPLAFIKYLSPFYYYTQARTLVPGNSFDWAGMGIVFVAALVALYAASILFRNRDIGGVSWSRIGRTRPVNFNFRPSRVWHRWLWLNWIVEQRLGIASWALGLGFFAGLEAGVVPAALKLVNQSGGPLAKFLAKHGGTLSADQFMSAFVTDTALLVAGFVVYEVGRWVSDSSQHRIDVFLIYPVSMWRLLVERMASLLAMSALIGLAIAAGILAGAAIGGLSITFEGVLRTFGAIVLLCFAIGGFGLLATTVLRSGMATGVTGGLLVASFFLTIIADLLGWPSWTKGASVFDAFGSPYLSLPGTGSLIYLVALGAVGVVIAYGAMRRGMRVAD